MCGRFFFRPCPTPADSETVTRRCRDPHSMDISTERDAWVTLIVCGGAPRGMRLSLPIHAFEPRSAGAFFTLPLLLRRVRYGG